MLVRILGPAGRLLVAAGVLALLFTAYQVWGTGILESHSQKALRSQLDRELPSDAAGRARARKVGTGPAGSSGSTGGPPQTAPPIAAPATGKPVGVIRIPSIGLDQVVVEGVQAAQLRTGPGHYPGTPLPGEAGNVAIAGHRTTYAHPFYDLNAVAPGDKITITTPQGIFVYAARGSSVVPPTDVSVIAPSAGSQLTLTTCNPRYSAATRLVLHATLVRSELFGDGGRGAAAPPAVRPTGGRAGGGRAGAGTDLAGSDGSGNWLAAVVWAVAVVAAAAGMRRAARYARHRWAVYLPGTVVLLVLLFAFFSAVSPLLPASF